MPGARLTSRGEVTVPKEIRDALGVSPGAKLVFRRKESGEVVVEAATIGFRSLAGILKPRKHRATLGRIEAAIRRSGAGK